MTMGIYMHTAFAQSTTVMEKLLVVLHTNNIPEQMKRQRIFPWKNRTIMKKWVVEMTEFNWVIKTDNSDEKIRRF
jgi:hypothetical protein